MTDRGHKDLDAIQKIMGGQEEDNSSWVFQMLPAWEVIDLLMKSSVLLSALHLRDNLMAVSEQMAGKSNCSKAHNTLMHHTRKTACSLRAWSM